MKTRKMALVALHGGCRNHDDDTGSEHRLLTAPSTPCRRAGQTRDRQPQHDGRDHEGV